MMKETNRGYRIVSPRRPRNNASEEKSNTPRALKTKLYNNQRNKKIIFYEKIGIKVPKSTREELIMDIMKNNTL